LIPNPIASIAFGSELPNPSGMVHKDEDLGATIDLGLP
jgi:hypothetical protein